MMHRAWSSIVEVPYCFSRSYVKFQGHTALKIVEFDPNWAFPDCDSSLNSPMAMKCCTKLETAKERCPIVFQSHPSNFKVTRYKTSPILTQIGRFRTIGQSQLSNPSDLPCFCILFQNWSSIGYILSKDKAMSYSSIIGNIMPADGLLIQRSQGCCAILGYPSETHLKLKSLEISFNNQLSWNFAQSTVVSLSCFVQNCKTFGQLKQMSWRNEISQVLSLRSVSDEYLILHSTSGSPEILCLWWEGKCITQVGCSQAERRVQNRWPNVLYVFEHKTKNISIHALHTCIVAFWHISNIPPKIS